MNKSTAKGQSDSQSQAEQLLKDVTTEAKTALLKSSEILNSECQLSNQHRLDNQLQSQLINEQKKHVSNLLNNLT